MKRFVVTVKKKLSRLIRSESARSFALGVLQGFEMCL